MFAVPVRPLHIQTKQKDSLGAHGRGQMNRRISRVLPGPDRAGFFREALRTAMLDDLDAGRRERVNAGDLFANNLQSGAIENVLIFGMTPEKDIGPEQDFSIRRPSITGIGRDPRQMPDRCRRFLRQ